jgi:glucose/arabinose dehydrogenase
MSPRRARAAFAAVMLCSLLSGFGARAATLPTGFAETRVANGMDSPTAMAFAPDGRVFVAQQGGALRVVKNGALLSQPFLSLSVNSSGERGLLGVAFDPNFTSNGFVYVYYTTSSSPVHNRLSRFTASAANPDVVAGGSEVQLLNLPSLSSATNHNGGAIHFGTDGKLYIAVGENANGSNSQSLSTTLGKVLRINADGSIPSDNPFLGQTTGINQSIWAMGLRNPFTFAVDRTNGRIHVNDVGQDSWEEVNLGAAGANYGWPQIEGPNPAGVAGRTYPIHNYQIVTSSATIAAASSAC